MSRSQGKFKINKKDIIRNKNEIKDLFLNGNRFIYSNLTIIYKPDGEPGVGFFASKKLKGAVKRNRVKRILREAYRMNKEVFMGFKVIFYAQSLLDAEEVLKAFQAFKKGVRNGK
uniref:Ribonuclease P protein component n=1 Tax=candidate division WOR-3 bacterium TaxID=2052148 RepID=A0A7V3VTQ9_UNCW3